MQHGHLNVNGFLSQQWAVGPNAVRLKSVRAILSNEIFQLLVSSILIKTPCSRN